MWPFSKQPEPHECCGESVFGENSFTLNVGQKKRKSGSISFTKRSKMYNLTQDVIDDLLAQQEAAIELAIKSVLSEGYLITDIATKGVFQKYPDGREIFIFNGKPLLEFGPCEVKIDESHKMTVSRSLKYLEDKC